MSLCFCTIVSLAFANSFRVPRTLQKFTTFSPLFDLLAIGTTDIDGTKSTVSILTYPDMAPVWSWKSSDSKADGELVDIDFSADGSSVRLNYMRDVVDSS